MAELSTENSDRIAITAQRLRAVQVDFTDQPVELSPPIPGRRSETALSAIEPEKRAAFMDELRGTPRVERGVRPVRRTGATGRPDTRGGGRHAGAGRATARPRRG